MKYLKIILAIIAAILLLFVAIGFLFPSITYTSEITVEKPINEAWDVMNDPNKTMEWLKDLTKIEHVSGTAGTVGAVTKYTFTDKGKESKIYETMKAIDPYRSVEMDFDMKDVMKMEYKVNFEEKNGSTIIKSNTKVKGQSMLMRSLVPLLKGNMQTQEDQNLINLRVAIESNMTDYSPNITM